MIVPTFKGSQEVKFTVKLVDGSKVVTVVTTESQVLYATKVSIRVPTAEGSQLVR